MITDDIILQISQRLKEVRKDKNITLQEVADIAGVSKGLLSQVENSRTIPSLPVLFNLIKALEIDLNDLLTWGLIKAMLFFARPANTSILKRKMPQVFITPDYSPPPFRIIR